MTLGNRFSKAMVVIALGSLFSASVAALTTPTIEPRIATAPNSGQTLVFTFNKEVTGGTATVTLGTAVVGSVTLGSAAVPPAPNDLIVNLTGVTNLQCVTVTLSAVTALDGGTGGTGAASVRYIAGDVNGDGIVSSVDRGIVTFNQSLLDVTASNYLKDVDASGKINSADRGAVTFRQSLTSLPNCP